MPYIIVYQADGAILTEAKFNLEEKPPKQGFSRIIKQQGFQQDDNGVGSPNRLYIQN